VNRRVNLSRPTFIRMRAQAVTDDLFPSLDDGLDFCTPVVARGFLPSHAAGLGDAAEVGVALYRRGFNRDTWYRRGPWRHNHRRVRATVSDCGVNTVLISKPEQTPQICMLSLLFRAATTDLEPVLMEIGRHLLTSALAPEAVSLNCIIVGSERRPGCWPIPRDAGRRSAPLQRR
jgi:hypothetical protein